MAFYQNKKSGLKSFLADILLAIVAFLLIVSVLEIFKGQAEAKAAESICRGSVALREKWYREVTVAGTKQGAVATPLLCRTLDKYIPENKDATKEQVEKELAKLMAKCWHQFGEGRIQDVFKQGDPLTKNCFICYDISIRETPNFKGASAGIKSAEFYQYLFRTPYKAYGYGDSCKTNGGFCADADTSLGCADKISADPSYIFIDKKNDACSEKGKKACCYTEYECWNRGGICSAENPDANKYSIYNDWDCPSSKKGCYIKKEDYFSYGDYIQKYGGQGNFVISSDIKPGETYSISFGSPNTHSCELCTKLGIGAGAIGGSTLALYALYLAPTGPIGWGVGGVAAAVGAGVGFIGAYAPVKAGTEFGASELNKLLGERQIDTIYFTTLNQMQQGNTCSVVKDIRDD